MSNQKPEENAEIEGLVNNSAASSSALTNSAEVTEGFGTNELEAILPSEIIPDDLKQPEIKRPSYQTHDDYFKIGDKTLNPGLYWHGFDSKEPPTPIDFFICTPLYAEALTCDENNVGWGLLLRFINPDGKWRTWAMPTYMLKGSGEEMRGELWDMGVRISPDGNKALHRWLASQIPPKRIIAATRTGWHEGRQGVAFVLPHVVIGSEDVCFQSEYATQSDFSKKGTLRSWINNVAMPCRNNSILLLSLSSAFSGPLLKIAKLQEIGGAGLHLMGDSSRGKTTALQVGASVWGAPGFMRTWRATANGLEATAASRNDTFLALDECGESDPNEIGVIIYALANGVGKQRARRTGSVREAARWRTIILSSGECSISTHMGESGKRIKAGQQARLLDIPSTHFKYGAFEYLHDSENGRVFADRLKRATSKDYGHAGLEFIEKLISDKRDLPALYAEICKLPAFCSIDGVESRAASIFALIGLAGELATRYGLTGWEQEDALNAAIELFKSWKSYRGSGKTEDRRILQGVSSFILKHSDSRFSELDMKSETIIRERAGWWKTLPDGRRMYLFTSEALKEAAPGFDVRKITDALDQSGWIIEKSSDKRSKKIKINGDSVCLYHICPKWDDEL